MSSETLGSIGVIGVGHIGVHYVHHLLGAGYRVLAFDAQPQAVERASAQGATTSNSIGELAADVDAIILSLPNPPAVRSVLSGPQGVFAYAKPGTLIIDASTVDPDTVRTMHTEARQHGLDYIETPISGGEPGEGGTVGASAASVTFMVGGDRRAFERALPVLNVLGTHALYLGPSGTGSIIKLLSNHVAGLVNLVASEACALGAAAGISVETLLEVFSRTDANTFMMLEYSGERLRKADHEAGFSIDLMHKDHRLAADLANQLAVPTPFNTLALEIYQRMRERGLGHRDVTQSYPSYVAMHEDV